jgi:hypothetical protein
MFSDVFGHFSTSLDMIERFYKFAGLFKTVLDVFPDSTSGSRYLQNGDFAS